MANVAFPKGISPGTGSLQFSDLTGCEVSEKQIIIPNPDGKKICYD